MQNASLLRTILREEWGWDGFVTSDFIFGLRDPVKSVGGGLDIEMPFRQLRATALAEALADGRIDEAQVDGLVTETVATLLRFWPTIGAGRPDVSVVLSDGHRALARRVAERSTVLLRNEGGLLPIDPAAVTRVAVIGRLAAVPNLGDGGSSDVHPGEVVTPLDGLRAGLPGVEVVHADDDASVAEGADLAVVVVGLTKADEGEFLDPHRGGRSGQPVPARRRSSGRNLGAAPGLRAVGQSGRPRRAADRPAVTVARCGSAAHDEALITEVAARSSRTVVVVMGGSAVVVPWAGLVPAVLVIWYPGMEGGHALADLVCGRAEPGGRLPFAIPTDEAHLVAFDPDATAVTYDGFHGQWLLDRDGHQPAFPFGFGLGYTSLTVEGARVESTGTTPRIVADVRNHGDRAGATVVQVYGGLDGSAVERPARRLLGFARVELEVGEQRSVEIACSLDPLRIRRHGGWWTEPGEYRIDVGLQANDPARVELTVRA